MCDGRPLTVQVVDLEEKDELLVRRLPGEVVHGVDELGHADGAVAVAVEDAEGALHEERLQREGGGVGTGRTKKLARQEFSQILSF